MTIPEDQFKFGPHIEELNAELERLKGIEVERDLLLDENNELHVELTKVRWEFASLKDALEGMAFDMGQMEGTIRELSERNRKPGDYDGP